MAHPAEVIVLFGGASGERRVSVATAQHIVAVLDAARPWFVAPDGAVFDCARAALSSHTDVFERDLAVQGPPRAPDLATALSDPGVRACVFVLGFHGGAGEDGTVQRMLEDRGLAFTGSGSAASARAFDKSVAKGIARERGVRTAESVTLARGDFPAVRDALAALIRTHGRAVAKPVADGSSVGLHHVRNADDVEPVARAIASRPEVPYLAEAFIAGTELTVGVLDGPAGRRALPASEVAIAPGRAFDFEGKYLGKGTEEFTPARVPAAVSRAAQDLALTVHGALGCEGYSRTDVIATEAGPVFLETNTLPGLTRASFFPQQLAVAGVPVREFLEGQVALALARRDRAR